MSTTVLEHYPVDRLPKDLRDKVPGAEKVRLTLEPELASGGRSTLTEILDELRALREAGIIKPISAEEAVARIRELRDEWDD